ncbi:MULTISPECIES: hypothetical protein [unclassified Streptomyces]|uniref:hypothetical protein n=1 Tax=unclassified Streptomyces TaxID=2593676 RepID=UPI0033191FF1
MNEAGVARREPVWLVAANVVAWRRCGAGGRELRPGTKFFKGGAKVYVTHVYWGPGGERLTAMGRERHTGRWIAIDTATRHLHGFRPKLVHTPRVLELLHPAGGGGSGGSGAEHAADVATTLERYARQYRARIAPHSPHPDRCLCHACLTGE